MFGTGRRCLICKAAGALGCDPGEVGMTGYCHTMGVTFCNLWYNKSWHNLGDTAVGNGVWTFQFAHRTEP